jgi:hypothetical protein
MEGIKVAAMKEYLHNAASAFEHATVPVECLTEMFDSEFHWLLYDIQQYHNLE